MLRPWLARISAILEIPNLLSLDAPLVAIGWQLLLWKTLAPNAGDRNQPSVEQLQANLVPPNHAIFFLFATVWLIYMADRLLDCRKLDFSKPVARRHALAARWSHAFWFAWSVVLVFTAGVAVQRLGQPLWLFGGGLLAFVVAYGYLVHGTKRISSKFPKELVVGVIFGIGVSLPTILRDRTWTTVISLAWLCILLVLNCLIVARVQEPSDRKQETASAIILIPGLARLILPLLLAYIVLSCIAYATNLIPQQLIIAMLLSGLTLLLFAIVHAPYAKRQSAISWGFLADYCLMTPYLIMATSW